MAPMRLAAAALAALSLLQPASGGNRCTKETCSAADPAQRNGPHYALLQVRNRLSSMVGKPEEDPAHELLPAESLVEVQVFRSSNLTDFEKDYIEDSSNPLDVGEKKAAAADAKAAAKAASKASGAAATSAASNTVGKPGQEEVGAGSVAAGSESPSCCEAMTAECLACKDGSSLEDYCVLHGDVKGCEKAFDCSAGHEHWKLGWSELKKMWCCTYKQKGCATPPNRTAASASGSAKTSGSWEDDLLNDGETPDTPAASRDKSAHEKKAGGKGCVTRLDPRATAFGYVTATPGTPCVFGVDDRDEGAHCIMDDGKFGSYGWCWTARTMDTWGSCSESCPLFGPSKVLERQIEVLTKKLEVLATTTTTTTTTTSTNATTTATTTVMKHKKPATTTTVAAHKKPATTTTVADNKKPANGNTTAKNATQTGGKPGSQPAPGYGPNKTGSAAAGPGKQAASQQAGPGKQPAGGKNAGPSADGAKSGSTPKKGPYGN